MRSHEYIIHEATDESVDLLTISKYIAQYLIDQHPRTGLLVTLSDMATSHPLPKFRSGIMINLLFDKQLRFNLHKPVKDAIGWYEPDSNSVSLDRRLINHNTALVSVLSHEIQHALDDYKSAGYAMQPHKATDTHTDYLKRPQEINARFAQVLVDVVNAEMTSLKTIGRVGSAKEAMQIIEIFLNNHTLSRKSFPTGDEGNRQYNRLVSRAYKFYDESKHLVSDMSVSDDDKKLSFIDKIKRLITHHLL